MVASFEREREREVKSRQLMCVLLRVHTREKRTILALENKSAQNTLGACMHAEKATAGESNEMTAMRQGREVWESKLRKCCIRVALP